MSKIDYPYSKPTFQKLEIDRLKESIERFHAATTFETFPAPVSYLILTFSSVLKRMIFLFGTEILNDLFDDIIKEEKARLGFCIFCESTYVDSTIKYPMCGKCISENDLTKEEQELINKIFSENEEND